MRAVTRRLLEPVDLNGFCGGDGYLFVRGDVGLAGRGVAARVPSARVVATLGAVERDDAIGVPGCGPVAFGALPFRPDHSGELVIPRIIVGADADGHAWVTVIDDTPADLSTRRPPPVEAASFTIRSGFDPDDFKKAVVTGRDRVKAGELTKVVLARDVHVVSDREISVHAVLLRLRAAFSTSYRYCVDGFIGASPELLVERRGEIIRSHPLAGTAPRTGDPETDARFAAELIASMKDQIEHRIVIEVVEENLLPFCSYLDWEAEPTIVTVANVQHLGSAVEGHLSTPPANVLELVHALQPTPALGGHPRDIALAAIAELEPFDRGRYGGAVGWVDADGNGTWAVAIRCAEISGSTARLFAGVGVVADSDPDAELAETQAKLQAMLGAIVRP